MLTFEEHGYSIKVCGIDNNWKVKIKPSLFPTFPLTFSPHHSPVPS